MPACRQSIRSSKFAASNHPEHAGLIQRVLAIPSKKGESEIVTFLNEAEIAALLASPDRGKRTGRRDRALLMVALQTGLRATELRTLRVDQIHFGPGAHIFCIGKGRKQRCIPLTPETVAILKVWLQERGGDATSPAFPGASGE